MFVDTLLVDGYIMSSYADVSIFSQEPQICGKFPEIDFLVTEITFHCGICWEHGCHHLCVNGAS